MDKIREIIRLHELGYSQGEIARSCLVARSTVQDDIRRAAAQGLHDRDLQDLSQSEARARLGKGKRRASTPAAPIDFATVHRELSRKGVTLALLWQEGLDRQSWNLSYGGFCRRYNPWKGRHNLSMRQVYKAGEKLFVDYCGLTVPVVDVVRNQVIDAQIFVASFGASNDIYAEATPAQASAHWIGSHQRALEFFGGVPACIIPDNLTAGVTAACRDEPGLNAAYQEFAEHYQIAVMPARPRKPRDKAKVEKSVQEVERQILAPLRDVRFASFSQLNQAIRARLVQLNQRTMKGDAMSRQALFEQTDQPALKPLPPCPFVFASWKEAKVSLDDHIEVEKHYYSVPYWFVQRQVRVKTSERQVEVFYDNRRIAIHERARVPYRHSTRPEHMPPEHWAYKQQSQQTFLTWAATIGPETVKQVEAIFARKDHEEQAFRTLKGVQRLHQRDGRERLEGACRRANQFSLVGLKRLQSILTTNLDATEPEPEMPATPPHDNLRGSIYYQ
jgi:transposase